VEQGMAQIHRVTILLPLVVGASAVLCTTFIHALALGATVNFFRYERRRGRAGLGFWTNLSIAGLVISLAFVAHLIEIALWAGLFVVCGEFQDFGTAYYHSAVNYTTLGYGDMIMSPSWKLLGPLEGADGALMFGVSTAMIFAVTQRLILAQFEDLRD
jgi:Ion channel